MTKRFSLPPMQESVLENGLRLILIPEHTQEGLVAALQLSFGRFCDPPGKEGRSEICIGLMQKGTESKTTEELSDEFEQHGATVFAEVGEEHAMIGVKMLARFKETLFPRFWEMITAPRLDKKEFSRIQREMTTALQAERVDPGTIANRHFFRALVGRQHPAGRFHTAKTLKKLTCSEIVSFYREYVAPSQSTLVIAGDFSRDWFEGQCLSMISAWDAVRSGGLVEAPPVERGEKIIRFVEKNDLTQVSLMVGQSAPGELAPERMHIALANYAFGAGNFSSRLMTRVRSSAGKTYGIVSHIAAERYFGALTIATSTQNRQLQEVLSSILNEFSLFCREGITSEEFEKAKRFAVGNMAFQLEGLTNLVEKTLWLRFFHRSNCYIETFDEMIGSISLQSVNEAVQSCFNPEKLVIVGVGKRSEILEQLCTFGKVQTFHYSEKIK
jgi:zinc protease